MKSYNLSKSGTTVQASLFYLSEIIQWISDSAPLESGCSFFLLLINYCVGAREERGTVKITTTAREQWKKPYWPYKCEKQVILWIGEVNGDEYTCSR